MNVVARPDNTRLTWFKEWLKSALPLCVNPWSMSSRSEQEAAEPVADLSNFADWYRHLVQEDSGGVSRAVDDLRTLVPGLDSLNASEAGLGVRVVQARIELKEPNQTVDVPLGQLSEGQRALIALYMLLHCHVREGVTLLIDEPDNFLALAEIQPWLMKLLDRMEEVNGQVITISHHPEPLNQLADCGGFVFDRKGGGPTRVFPFEPQDDSGLTPAELIARGWEGV